MRNVLFSAALAVSAPFLFAACAADQSAPEGDAVETTDEALAASARKVTTHYEGSFTDSGETFTVALDVELPSAAIGYQKMRSNFWHSDSPHCDVFTEWTPGTMTLKVTGSGGRVVAEKKLSASTGGHEPLNRDVECPDGHLVNPRAIASLQAEIMDEGVEVLNEGHKIHIPRGYFSPGFVQIKGSASFRALSAGKVEHESNQSYKRSEWEIPRGVIRVSLPSETTVSVGIKPSMQGTMGYEKIVDVTLHAR
jgi:hypothetical protein